MAPEGKGNQSNQVITPEELGKKREEKIIPNDPYNKPEDLKTQELGKKREEKIIPKTLGEKPEKKINFKKDPQFQNTSASQIQWEPPADVIEEALRSAGIKTESEPGKIIGNVWGEIPAAEGTASVITFLVNYEKIFLQIQNPREYVVKTDYTPLDNNWLLKSTRTYFVTKNGTVVEIEEKTAVRREEENDWGTQKLEAKPERTARVVGTNGRIQVVEEEGGTNKYELTYNDQLPESLTNINTELENIYLGKEEKQISID